MIQLLKESIVHFKNTWRKHLAFAVLTLLLTSRLIIPLFSHLIHRLLIGSESGVLLNRDVFQILLDYRGLLGLFLLLLLSILVVFIELGTFLYLAKAGMDEQEVSVSTAIVTTLRQLPRILRIEVLVMMGTMMLFLPLIQIPVKPQLLGGIEPPAILIETIQGSPVFRTIYWSVVVVFVYLFLRLLFTLHAMLIEKRPPWRAMLRSFELTRNRHTSLLVRWGLLQGVLMFFGLALGYLLSRVPEIRGIPLSHLVNRYTVTVSGLVLRLYTLLLMPLSMTVLTLMYHREIQEDAPFDAYVRILVLEKIEGKIASIFARRRVLAVVLLSFLVVGSFFMGASANEEGLYLGRSVAVAAHRGGGSSPENSLSAISTALEEGADTIEMDVQITGDGIFVLHHDLTLERMTGDTRRVIDLESADLATLGIGGGERLPTLEEAILLIGDRADLLIDVKVNGPRAEVALALLRLLARHDRIDGTLVQSFDANFLAEVRRLKPEMRIGQILYYALGDLGEQDVDFFSVQKGMLDAALARRLHEENKGIWVWTTDTDEEIKNALQHDIEGLITKSVPLTLEILGREAEVFEE